MTPNQNNGASTSVLVRNQGSGGTRQGLVRFNLSALDPTSPVGRGKLRLFVGALDIAGLIDVHAVLDPWNEATLTAGTVPQPSLGPTLISFPIGTADRNRYVEVDITDLVQDWMEGTLANNGLALVPSVVDDVRVDFNSKENTTTSHPIELEVVSAADITGVAAGTGLSGGGTSGEITINLQTCNASGQILKWGTLGWQCDLDLTGAGGTVTSVGSGPGLTGGPITTVGTLSLDTAFTDSRYSLLSHSHDTSYLFKSGDTMTGTLNLPANGLVAGTNQLVLSGGKVGIGTTSPSGLFHVQDNTLSFDFGGTPSFTRLGVVLDALSVENAHQAAIRAFFTDTSLNPAEEGARISFPLSDSRVPTEAMGIGFWTRTGGGPVTEQVRIDPGGQMGIGTTTPDQKLEVAGNVKISGGGNGLIFPDNTVQTTAATSGGGTVTSVGSGPGLIGGAITTSGTLSLDTVFTDSRYSLFSHTHDANYVFKFGDTMTGALNLPANGLLAGTDQLVLSGGNVGVGTSPSNYRLHVKATAGPSQHLMAVQGGALGSVNSGGISFLDAAGTSIGFIGDGSQGNDHIYVGADLGSLILYTGATNSLVIDPSHRVGIGTDLPTVRLDVGGDVRSSGQLMSTVGSGTPPLSVASSTNVPNLNADLLDGLDSTAFASAGALGALVAKSGDTMTGALNLPADGLAAGGGQLVLSSGNVGIGTAAPTQRLEVAGNVQISGAGSGLRFADGTIQMTAPGGPTESVVIINDDFDTGFLATATWTASFVGNGSLAFNPGYLRLDNSSGSGGDSATIRSNKQFSVNDGTLIFKAALDAYHDSIIYGDFQPRGLATGTNRNNAIEFVSAGSTSVACRTVAGGTATETVVNIGVDIYEAYSFYQIVATPSVVKFHVNGDLVATHTTNIPTAPLNVLFTTYDGGVGTTPIDINSVTFEIRR